MLAELLENYSMAQMALISHVSYLKFKDEEDRTQRETKADAQGSGSPVPHGRVLNKEDRNNAQAFAMIAGGILG